MSGIGADPRGAWIAAQRADGVAWKLICRALGGLSREHARRLMLAWQRAAAFELPGVLTVAAAPPHGGQSCHGGILGLDAARVGLEAWPAMSFFSGPKLPPVTPTPAPPTKEDPAVERARLDAQRRAAGLRRGRQAMLLTGGRGVTEAPTVAQATLLGG